MKNLIKSLFLILLVSTTISKSNAQTAGYGSIKENSSLNVNNMIELRGSSDTREVQIEITKEGSIFNLNIHSEIRTGTLKIEIFDNNGKKQGSFSTGIPTEKKPIKIETDTKVTNYEEKVSGSIIQKNASIGTWTVRIIPQNAYGRIMLQYSQTATN